MTRLFLVLALGMVVPTLARADAIMPVEGDCPPGLDVAISGHSEVCVPRACRADVQCGARAACREIAECWAPREVSPSGGRLADDSAMRDVPIGLCGAGGACTEGTCATRRQCEPTVTTQAWDPTARRWTAHPYEPPLLGCSASHGRPSVPLAVLLLGATLATAAVTRRRAANATSRGITELRCSRTTRLATRSTRR